MNPYRIAAGFVVAFLVGVAARWFDIPVPAPPTFVGAFLIVMMTAGWIVTDQYLTLDEVDQQSVSKNQVQSDRGSSSNN